MTAWQMNTMQNVIRKGHFSIWTNKLVTCEEDQTGRLIELDGSIPCKLIHWLWVPWKLLVQKYEIKENV